MSANTSPSFNVGSLADKRPRTDALRELKESIPTVIPNLADDDPITITVTPAPWYALLENHAAPSNEIGPLTGLSGAQQPSPMLGQNLASGPTQEPIKIKLHLHVDKEGNIRPMEEKNSSRASLETSNHNYTKSPVESRGRNGEKC